MLFAVLFEDAAGKAEVRQGLMPEHLDFLERNRSAIRGAGPLGDSVSGEGAGGLWLVETENSEAVKRIYESDPFWPSGLRKSVRVLAWTQVFADGRRLI
jgi:uncharacterized protein YciI